MDIFKNDCVHYGVCLEDSICDGGCHYCGEYEREYTIEDGIDDINNNHDELKSMFEHHNEFFEVLTRNLINLKRKYGLKVTLSMMLTTEIMDMYKTMLNTESIINNFNNLITLTSSDKEQMEKTFEKCAESLNALCKIDAKNGGSLIHVLNRIFKQEAIPIGMIGISECDTLITINDSTGEFELIENRFPAKKDSGNIEDVAPCI